MRLDANQLAEFIRVLDKVESKGLPAPRYPGRLGSYLRQHVKGRRELPNLLSEAGLQLRADGAVSGATLGAIELTALARARDIRTGELWGPAARLPIVCEELGGMLDLTLWLAGQTASGVHDAFVQSDAGGSVRLEGDYQWTPPARLTTGEASPGDPHDPIGWPDARCLKATSDDLDRPPHALEYALDLHLGPPGLKCFRTVCARLSNGSPRVLPGLRSHRAQEISLSENLRSKSRGTGLAKYLVYREPWSDEWIAVDSRPLEDNEALAHSIEWLDFRRELEGRGNLENAEHQRLQQELHAIGVRSSFPRRLQLTRRLLEPARQVIGSLRGHNRFQNVNSTTEPKHPS